MTDAAAPPPASADAPDPAAERVARQCRVLEELAEIGLALARTLLRRAEAAADAPGAADGESVAAAAPLHGDPGLTFDRLSRAIRLTQRLETEIAQGEAVRQTQAGEARARAARAADDAEWDAWTEARHETVLEVVEKTLEADGQDDETIIDRLREARDWLECDDDFDVIGMPTGLVIDRICKAFSVTPVAMGRRALGDRGGPGPAPGLALREGWVWRGWFGRGRRRCGPCRACQRITLIQFYYPLIPANAGTQMT